MCDLYVFSYNMHNKLRKIVKSDLMSNQKDVGVILVQS